MATDLITNNEIQAALIGWLKSRPNIVNSVYDSDEIKEDQWQGTAFVFPAIRVRLISNKPDNRQGCIQSFTYGIQVFTEDASTQNCDRIAGIIAKEIHGNQFIASNLQFANFVTNLVPSYRRDERTWMAEVLVDASVLG